MHTGRGDSWEESPPPPKLEDCLTGLREKPKGRQAGDLGSSGEGQWRRGGAMLLELGFKKAGMFSNWVSEQLRMAMLREEGMGVPGEGI